MYAVIPTGSGGQDEGLQLPHVILWAQRVVQGLSTKYTGLFLLKVGYVRAMSDQPQLWHRDMPLELQNLGVEHAFSCFMRVNLDCPTDGRENIFVYRFGFGVPYPWQEVLMSMLAGDLWILSTYITHGVGAIPSEAPAGSTRTISFATIALCRIDCDHSSTLGRSPRATAIAAVDKSRALYNSPVQPPGEGRPAAEVCRL